MSTKLTCRRALELHELLRNSSTEEFLQEWHHIYAILKFSLEPEKFPLDPLSSCRRLASLLLHDFLATCSQFPVISREISTEKGPSLLKSILSEGTADRNLLAGLLAFFKFYPSLCAK